MLQAIDLECVRGDHCLFSRLNLSLKNGDLLHVQGKNGCGKTSLLRILTGLLPPTSGKVLWDGVTINALGGEYKKTLSYIGHLNAQKDDLSALENLMVSSRISAAPVSSSEVGAALQRFGITAAAQLPFRVLSQGQKRRVALAKLLLSKATLWLLDEPFAALDSSASDLLRTIVGAHLAQNGIAVISSHRELDIPGGTLKRLALGL